MSEWRTNVFMHGALLNVEVCGIVGFIVRTGRWIADGIWGWKKTSQICPLYSLFTRTCHGIIKTVHSALWRGKVSDPTCLLRWMVPQRCQ